MFEELTIQGYQQMVRHVIFQIYEILVDKYLNGNFKLYILFIIFRNKNNNNNNYFFLHNWLIIK